MTQEELNLVLESHRKWLRGEEGGRRAILLNTNLSGLSLHGADLTKADLRGANLFKTDLQFVNLEEADLSKANLSEAELFYGRLSNACLNKANLQNADLTYAFLFNADLSEADLCDARLSGIKGLSVNLSNANLQNADLRGANLTNADLRGADLRDAIFDLATLTYAKLDKIEEIRRGICLDKVMIGYKKCRNGVIVTLEIPQGAMVCGINKRMYRTNMAKVIDFDKNVSKAVSLADRKFIYRKGETVYPSVFDCQYDQECGAGIHFFRTKKEAEEYMKGE